MAVMISKKKPAIWKTLEGSWVNLEELAEILGMTPEKVLKNYIGLKVTIYFEAFTGEIVKISSAEEIDTTKDIFVRECWALDVLRARDKGFAGVKLVPHEHPGEDSAIHHGHCTFENCPTDALLCICRDGQHIATVGIRNE